MGIPEKAKEVVDTTLEKAGEYSGKAAEKAAELAQVAREKAPAYLDRAAELAGKAVDVTAAGVDKATGGRFHDQIDSAHDVVGDALGRVRPEPAKDGPVAPPFAGGLGTPTPAADAAEGPDLDGDRKA